MQARRIKTGQPHIPDNNNPERVFAILVSDGEIPPFFLGADMRLPIGPIVRAPSHHHFGDAGFPLFRLGVIIPGPGPLGAQLDQRIVKVDANAPAHADDHRFAV